MFHYLQKFCFHLRDMLLILSDVWIKGSQHKLFEFLWIRELYYHQWHLRKQDIFQGLSFW